MRNVDGMSAEEFEKLAQDLAARLGSNDPTTHCDVVKRITDTWLEQIKSEEPNNPLLTMVAPLLYAYGHRAMHLAFEYGIQFERTQSLPTDFDDLTAEDFSNGK